MQRNNKILGSLGENIACDYLSANHYTIHTRNWRFGRAEVDIIAFDTQAQTLVFVEVKTRKNIVFGYPEDSIGLRKQNLLFEIASEYMHQINYEQEFRFDIISIIVGRDKNNQINHYRDAFFPEW